MNLYLSHMENYMQEQITLPHDVVKLPSGGIFYRSRKKAIKVGYLTASDENILLTAGENKDTFLMTLLRNKIYEHDLRPEEMIEGDVATVMVFLRNTAFGSEYSTTLIDPATNKPFQVTVSLEEVDFIKPRVNPSEDGYFTTTLPKSGKQIKLRPLNYGQINEINKKAEMYQQNAIIPIQTWRLTEMIIEMDGNTDKGFIAQNVEQLPISDSKYIRTFMSENVPGLDMNKVAIAPSGEKVPFRVNFGVDFFRPFF